MSESTVKTYVGAILPKLALRDRVQIVEFAHQHGLVRGSNSWGAPQGEPTGSRH